MLDEHDRPGKLEGRGFYEYEEGKRTGLWKGLRDAFPPVDDPSQISLRDLEERMLFVEAIEMFDRVERGDPHWLSIQFMKSQKIDLVAARLLLETFEDAFIHWLDAFTMPTLVVCGDEDHDNGSAEDLAGMLPDATYVEVPGTHMGSVTKPELGHAMADWLGNPA